MAKFATGIQFGIAVCEHLGLPPSRVHSVKMATERDEVFGVVLNIALDAAELEDIARRMGGASGQAMDTVARNLMKSHGGGSAG